jgi:hypothetical protein
LGPRPQLEVLRPIVVSGTVEVVHGFASHEVAPEKALGDENVFENVMTS